MKVTQETTVTITLTEHEARCLIEVADNSSVAGTPRNTQRELLKQLGKMFGYAEPVI